MSNYHRETAYRRDAMGGHMMDWNNQPDPYKRYQGLEPGPLAEPAISPAGFFDLALGWPPAPAPEPPGSSRERLAAVLLLAGGITALRRMGGEAFGLRAAASAGALYPFELYLISRGLGDPADGLHHFATQGPGLQTLRAGPLDQAAASALGAGPSRLTFLISGIYWRSVWKYRSRAYRYCLLDAGHLLANLELALAACGWSPAVSFDFIDQGLNTLLGLDPAEEAVLAAVRAGGPPSPSDAPYTAPEPITHKTLPLSSRPLRDQTVLAAHRDGNLETPPAAPPPPAAAPSPMARPLLRPEPGGPPLAQAIQARRSRRNFIPQPLNEEQISRLLAAALPQAGYLGAQVILPPTENSQGSTWRYHPDAHALQPWSAPPQAHLHAAKASLEQMWVGQAALILVLWADLDRLAEQYGPRAYRHAMLQAGRAGQRLYLAATALGLGCCGVGAFYDDELARALNLPPNAQPLYLLATGPVKGGL